MTHEDVQSALNLIGAGTALVAGYFWSLAARQPVAKYVGAEYGVTAETTAPINAKIQRGADLNARAATFTAVSAFAQCTALLVTPVAHWLY